MELDKKGLEFNISVQANFPNLLMDEARIRQILFNLLGNAIKYTEQGFVKLDIRYKLIPGKNQVIEVQFIVEDSGIGMDEQFCHRIFESFSQPLDSLQASSTGTGLGLTITHRLVSMMGGTIHVSSQPRVGSTFKVILPEVELATQPKPNIPDGNLQPNQIAFQPATILVAEDDELNQTLAEELLNAYDLQVILANNGEEAIQLAIQHEPDLILMDLLMPRKNGDEASQEIRQAIPHKKIPILALTGAALDTLDSKKTIDMFDDILYKPLSQKILIQKLSHFLAFTLTEEISDTQSGSYSLEARQYLPLSQVARQNLPVILEHLNGELRTLWEQVQKNHFVHQMEEFSKKMYKLGETYDLSVLKQYGQALISHTNNFDIEQMDHTLYDFPKIIALIKDLGVLDEGTTR